MTRRESGFSLLELMIALAIVAFVLAAASTFFVGVVKQYKVQSKITESNVESVIGLELMRQDIESLGFGLPWDLGGATYAEPDTPTGSSYTDSPRAVGSMAWTSGSAWADNSVYLIIRSASVGMASAAGKWTTLRSDSPRVRIWEPEEGNLVHNKDYVVVLSIAGANTPARGLQTYNVLFDNTGLSLPLPGESSQTNVVYGIDDHPLEMPFNRADYYIVPNGSETPRHCAPIAGTLVKQVVDHSTGALGAALPLLDCVADLQVVYGLDTNADGEVNTWTSSVAGLTASDIRAELVEVHVHVLAQIGQRDGSYTNPTTTISVGSEGINHDFNVGGVNSHYRWKMYNIIVKPKNMAK